MAAPPPRKVLQSWHFTEQNFTVLLFWKVSDECPRPQVNFYSSLHLSILRCMLVNFCSFLSSSLFFFFVVNNFFHFLYLMLPSLLYHLRKKIQTLGETRNGRSKSGKRKNAKSDRETRKKKEVHQFF